MVEITPANSNAKLASQQCSLIATISVDPTSSNWNIIRALRVHHCNVSYTLHWHSTSFLVSSILWTLSFRQKKRLWWALKSHISPNKKDVTRNCIDVGFFDEKLTHYLLETQIKLSPLHYNNTIHICISCDMHSLYMLHDHKVLKEICIIVTKWSNHSSWSPSIF